MKGVAAYKRRHIPTSVSFASIPWWLVDSYMLKHGQYDRHCLRSIFKCIFWTDTLAFMIQFFIEVCSLGFDWQYVVVGSGSGLVTHRWQAITWTMMTSSNGNIFRVSGHLYGEFTGRRWIPRRKTSDAELWCFLWSASEKKRLSKQSWGWWFETPSCPSWRHCNANGCNVIQPHAVAKGLDGLIGWAPIRCEELCKPKKTKNAFLHHKGTIKSWHGNAFIIIDTLCGESGGRLNKKDHLTGYGDSHVKDKTSYRPSYL